MRVLVTGAYGMIGSACLARLHAAGHDVVGGGRSVDAARRRFPYAQWIEMDFRQLQDAQAWEPLLNGIDAVVNCVGVLQNGWGDDVERVQLSGTMALFDACLHAGIKRVVHISALGADASGPSLFSRTKAAAEAHLRTLTLDWVILRPALVIGSEVYGGTALLRGVAAAPLLVPIVHADCEIQVIGLDDLAETVVRVLDASAPARISWDVAHPEVHKLADAINAIRGWLGFAPRPVLRLPDACARIIGAAGDAVGWLGWRNPARSTSFAELARGVVGDSSSWAAATGITPRSLHQLLAARPAGVADRWFARLYLLKPLAIVALVLATLTAALVQLVSAWRHAAMLPADMSTGAVAAYLAPALITGGLTLLFGVGLIFRATARLALLGLIALTLWRAAEEIQTGWHFGFFPHGVMAYSIPILLAMLLTVAILDDR